MDHKTADKDILVIEDVAEILHCSVVTLHRIPKHELPAYSGPGRKNLYLRDDIIRFLKTRRVDSVNIDRMLADIEEEIQSGPRRSSGRFRRRLLEGSRFSRNRRCVVLEIVSSAWLPS